MTSRKIELTIEGDINDADYISESTVISITELRKLKGTLNSIDSKLS